MTIVRNIIISFIFIYSSFAVENLTISPEAQNLLSEIRCITCTGQTVLGSQSEFADMITRRVISELDSGKSIADIKQELVNIYGNDILMTPKFSTQNALLWAAPILFLMLIGASLLVRYL